MVKEGDKAPDFELEGSDGQKHKLGDYKGRQVVLYFYPKDNTPGCTKQACSFRDYNKEIEEKGAVVLGVSGDSLNSHEKFKDKQKLPFVLLSDPKKEVIGRYGSLKEKSMFGKTFLGVSRDTFIIDEEGFVKKIFRKVKPEENAEEVLENL